MRYFQLQTAFLLVIFSFASLSSKTWANDEIFPPAPAASPAVNFDGKGFLIHGKREFIASGSIHYARVPRELWKDRLLKLKRAGFNTVQTYVFWNQHETEPGKFDFTTGSHDLGAFLQTAQEVGLYATVRVGPYDCAEWDSGGYPVWLRNVPDLKVRNDNPAFLNAVDKFWDQLIPIVAAHQINRGGNVILVQLENEDPEGWGTEMPNGYFTHLQKKALDLGIEVPYFFSGLHHGTNPGGDSPMDLLNRKNPWYSTETWIRWFDTYGNSPPEPLITYTRNVWNIIANGGNGFNLYMFHGGTNFDYWNDNSSGASYDYGTLVGEGGDLRNLYYSVKRAGTFATSFPDILENDSNASSAYAAFATGHDITSGTPPKTIPSVRPYARTSAAGTIVFVRNTQMTPQTVTLPSGQTLHLDPREIAPLLIDTTLAPGIRVKMAAVRTLGLATHGTTTTWIVYGKPEEKGHVELDLDQDGIFASGVPASAFQVQSTDARHPVIDFTFSEDAPQILLVTSGGQTLRIIDETPAWTDRTWIVGERGAQSVVTGPDYVGDFSESRGKAQITVARAFGRPALKELVIYGETPQGRHVTVTDPAPDDVDSAPGLGTWETAQADSFAAPGFADTDWLASADQPPQLGADNDPTAYGCYRASFDAPVAGVAKLSAVFVDHAVVFLNGAPVGPVSQKADIPLNVNAGSNTLAVFVSHHGREKAFNYVNQPIDTYARKGILGPVTLTMGSQVVPITSWKLHGGISSPDSADLSWQPAPAADLGLPAFFRTQFEAKMPTANSPCPIYRISTRGLTRGSVWLNGHNLGRYPQKIKIDGLYLPECWLKDGTNSLVIFDEEGHVPTAAVHLWCERAASREVFQVQE
jgi:beta-galactosidase